MIATGNPHALEAAFRRCIGRKVITAAEAIAHLRKQGWTELWPAYQAANCGNWYAFRAALRGAPGHQKTLNVILRLPENPTARSLP